MGSSCLYVRSPIIGGLLPLFPVQLPGMAIDSCKSTMQSPGGGGAHSPRLIAELRPAWA